MGHVDHGKTTLLDTLRQANVADNEAGGITQKISAFTVSVNNRQVVFLDTPGHAAFNAMRSHGAEATDIVVLVIAAEDGPQPQTIEALKYAKAASCNIIIALNKIDKIPVADRPGVRAKILGQLVEHDLIADDYGGDAQVFEISGKSGAGVPELIEGLTLQAEILELSAASEGPAEAVVLEASMEKGRGVVADILVRWGSLKVGDPIVVGTAFGKVKAMYTAAGELIEEATPSTPIRLLGLRTVPIAGQELITVSSENKAKLISARRQRLIDLKKLQSTVNTSADNTENSTDTVPTINVLLKADGVGTLEALQNVIKNVVSMTSDVHINVVGAAVGDVNQSDLDRALTVGNTIVLGFNINIIDADTRLSAKESDIKIFRDTVIYRLEDHLKDEMENKLPKERDRKSVV
jgi:translation initiation factor IF-2